MIRGKKKHGTARQATYNNVVRRMRIACWITKATDTHSEYVIFTAFPRQQWLRERIFNVTFIRPVLFGMNLRKYRISDRLLRNRY